MDLKQLLNPQSTAVIVVDKQSGYFDPAFVGLRHRELPSDSADTLEAIDSFIERSRSSGVEVIWTQMVEDTELSPFPIAEKMRNDPDNIHTITKPGTPSFEIYGRTKPEPTEKVIEKYRYNAFAKTDLAEYLRNKGIKTVVFVGGYASRCVLSSAVGANSEDLFCIVPNGLVLNQTVANHEVQTLYDVVNAIFGLTLTTEEIFSAWV